MIGWAHSSSRTPTTPTPTKGSAIHRTVRSTGVAGAAGRKVVEEAPFTRLPRSLIGSGTLQLHAGQGVAAPALPSCCIDQGRRRKLYEANGTVTSVDGGDRSCGKRGGRGYAWSRTPYRPQRGAPRCDRSSGGAKAPEGGYGVWLPANKTFAGFPRFIVDPSTPGLVGARCSESRKGLRRDPWRTPLRHAFRYDQYGSK
jgi:hypothetical protein